MTETVIVKVEILDPDLRRDYGPTHHYEISKARRGERKGIWRIIRDLPEIAPAPTVEQVIEASTQEIPAVPETGKWDHLVVWIQDNPLDTLGGAELSAKQVIKVGLECGFNIRIMTATDFSMEMMRAADVLILNNLLRFNGHQIRAIEEAVYLHRVPYVKYEHDHRELGREHFARRLFWHSRFNVFLSPVHLQNHKDRIGADGTCLPLALDVEEFKPVRGVERKANTAIVCNVRNFKSWTNLQRHINDHKDIHFDVLANDPVVIGPNVSKRAMVDPSDMPKLYSEYEYLVHILDGWGAGERVIFEGALCGCKIVANERAGHMSWKRDLENIEGLREWLREAPYEFWAMVERECIR